MLHVRVIAPRDVCREVVAALEEHAAVADVVHLEGSTARGSGDVVMFDVAREAANPVIDRLRELGVPERGSISMSESTIVLGEASERAEQATGGHPADGVVWGEIEDQAYDDARLSWSFLAFLILATLIAGVGRYLDQPILIVGAMVVGPEFAPLSAICVAVVRRRRGIAARAAATLLGGFAIAIGVAFAVWGIAAATGLIDPVQATSGPLTEFIVAPDVWSFLIALLAGVAGILSMTSAKSSALVGVFISITTVPAAATIALSLAVGDLADAAASAIQLGVNLLGLLVAGVATLAVQSVLTRPRRTRLRDSVSGPPADETGESERHERHDEA